MSAGSGGAGRKPARTSASASARSAAATRSARMSRTRRTTMSANGSTIGATIGVVDVGRELEGIGEDTVAGLENHRADLAGRTLAERPVGDGRRVGLGAGERGAGREYLRLGASDGAAHVGDAVSAKIGGLGGRIGERTVGRVGHGAVGAFRYSGVNKRIRPIDRIKHELVEQSGHVVNRGVLLDGAVQGEDIARGDAGERSRDVEDEEERQGAYARRVFVERECPHRVLLGETAVAAEPEQLAGRDADAHGVGGGARAEARGRIALEQPVRVRGDDGCKGLRGDRLGPPGRRADKWPVDDGEAGACDPGAQGGDCVIGGIEQCADTRHEPGAAHVVTRDGVEKTGDGGRGRRRSRLGRGRRGEGAVGPARLGAALAPSQPPELAVEALEPHRGRGLARAQRAPVAGVGVAQPLEHPLPLRAHTLHRALDVFDGHGLVSWSRGSADPPPVERGRVVVANGVVEGVRGVGRPGRARPW